MSGAYGSPEHLPVLNANSIKLTVVVPSFEVEGTLLATLRSIYEAAKSYEWKSFSIVISDSSSEDYVLDEVREWAKDLQFHLVIDHVDDRRIKKVALNTAFEYAEVSGADVVVVCDDDVRLDAKCIVALVQALSENPKAVVAFGVSRAEPAYICGRRRAGAWDLEVNANIATFLPRSFLRTEGAIFAMTGSFASSFRFSIGSGGIAEDQMMAEFIYKEGLDALNVFEAIVFRLPPDGYREFANQSLRTREILEDSTTPRPTLAIRIRAALQPSLKNPFGALFYIAYVVGILSGIGMPKVRYDEYWLRSKSTGRNSNRSNSRDFDV